ncbi:CCA tRNA nucleotidyltransferase [Treponema brennaborense]|uniref:Polynucleotide adenylyltransferase/metal dependent phosphohydrolase n=1 Tax=Treponema brennaborense (strain DSM 12168 / CIP 105900 / DD5/3) TaxID=906968 RepID=F4LMQ0_TREBD|nr:HD domain-containing protein [Treponema brennaborense]AEE16797.1 polynucleotide adenylyltransferase/metal dependent phosphohydrolase [Treponema brennaborense DSM 12168]
MKRIKIPHELQKMHEIFSEHGFSAYLVGGAVRDIVRGKTASDWDVATNATPQQVTDMFRRVIPTGIAHGTVTVHFMKREVEVTTFRTETGYSDGRHPDSVKFAATIEDDLSRRDFTMNAIAANLADGLIVDPFGGRDDIKANVIRTVGNADERFAEDGLRPIRALRFAAQLGFSIDPATLAAVPRAKEKTAGVSIERFRDEFVKMLKAPQPSLALRLMEDTGMLRLFLPELAACRGVEQADARGFHRFDVLDHLLYACDGAPARKLEVRLAALFHDAGKPAVKRTEIRERVSDRAGEPPPAETIYTFYNHETVSASITKNVLERLRFPNALTTAVCHLVKNHMFHYESSWTDAAVRRFLVRVTPQAVEDLFDLRIADVYGMTGVPPQLKNGVWSENLLELKDRIDAITAQNTALTLKDLAVNGADLIRAGIPAGKRLGHILRELLDTVIDDPKQNDRETLLRIAVNLNG